jgi:putative transcriptional regulator
VDRADREKRKITLEAVAEEAGVSYGAVQRLAANRFDRVDVSTLDRLCVYFGCEVGDLLEHVPDTA